MKKPLTLLTFICILFHLSECMNYGSFEKIDKEIAKLKGREEYFERSVNINKQKYEKACQSLKETRNKIEVLEEHKRQAAIAFGHAGQDQGLQGHVSQIIGNTSTGVEQLSGKMKQKMNIAVRKGHARYREGKCLSLKINQST
ncbi:unnamed protein product [Meloidogyne enterolobii]|uniref:Uncharacterized protein n=1 Tax=Meloidogyne enterolobii TaxID=390850 RepID=A0ACB0YEJ8_MELEN